MLTCILCSKKCVGQTVNKFLTHWNVHTTQQCVEIVSHDNVQTVKTLLRAQLDYGSTKTKLFRSV